MEVRTSSKIAVASATLFLIGCMNPGYRYLHPPGFSSTAHRVTLHRQHQMDLEMAQVMASSTESQPTPPQTSANNSSSKPGKHWLQIAAKPSPPETAANPAQKPESLPFNSRADVRFSGWPEKKDPLRTL